MAGRQSDSRGEFDTGRKGFREPDEPPDERAVIVRAPFWLSESERLTYEHAAESWPRPSASIYRGLELWNVCGAMAVEF